MFTKGEYSNSETTFGVILNHTKQLTEALLITQGTVVSAYRKDGTGAYSYNNNNAREMVQLIERGFKGCNSKNGNPMPFDLGAMTKHEFTKSKVEYLFGLYKGEICEAFIQAENKRVELEYIANYTIPEIPYTKLTTIKKDIEFVEDDLDAIQTRSVQEIALEKEDVTWLQKKNYFIVNEDETAEKLFSFLDNFNGPIAYDTETTGLKINCFGQINSKYKKKLDEYNIKNPKDKIRADKLVGIIFCVEEDTSYYFPCSNRKFKNLYESGDIREKLIDKFKATYIIGEKREEDTPIAKYWRDTERNSITSDVILMERVRYILETKHIVAHNGSFEYKVGMQYCIDTNIKDDTMILHQLVYKYRNGAIKEPSNLKYLAKVELGMDQWELKDFFPNWKPDKEGLVRKKPGSKFNASNQIDFSYMDYQGTRVYAPADGDATLGLLNIFKKDLVTNKQEQEYIYNVEVLVACAVGYMEFFGHRIDESKILEARARTMLNKIKLNSEIRQLIEFSNNEELSAYRDIVEFLDKEKELKLSEEELNNKLIELTNKLEDAINKNEDYQLNLSSPAQVSDLFFNKLNIPVIGDKPSVAKNTIKALLKEKNDDGTLRYPVASLYQKFKNEETLLSKFFDNLIYFTYPGGFIFSSYGQVATDTGRMACSKPNSQQYPKHITKIIVPRDNCVMVDADYSQIEYRVLTALAGNEELAKLFSDPDSDYHTLMASLMYGVDYSAVTSQMRSAAKSFNFGIPYGMGLGSLAILLTGKNTQQTRDEAAEKMEAYFKNQPRTKVFFDNVKEMAQVNGYTKTLFNRRRYYSFTDKDGNTNNAKKAAALRQAGNAVIQGTAADIFKIGVARNFSFIRRNKLFGKFMIVNMIHDEQLIEIDVSKLNMNRILAEIGKNMQFKLENFPPLYIGAGVSDSWGKAKGKGAEIHPVLLENFIKSHENDDIYLDKAIESPKDIVNKFHNAVIEFRRKKVYDYITDSKNWDNVLHPAIAGLINLQFNYGRGEDAKSYKGPNGETYTDHEFLMLNLSDFIKHNNLEDLVKTSYFEVSDNKAVDEEVEDDYEDEETEDDIDELSYIEDKQFIMVDESDKAFGSTIQDLIDTFGVVVSKQLKICGIKSKDMYFKRRDNIIDYLMRYYVEEPDEDSLQIVFLTDSNILNYTGIYVKGVDYDELEFVYRNNKFTELNYSHGDVKTRSQAK